MPNFFTSSFRGYLGRFFLVQAAVLAGALAASVVLVKYVVEPTDRVVMGLRLIQSATSVDGAFGDSHFVYGIVGSPDFPTFAGIGETVNDMEMRVRYYYRTRRPGRVLIQGDPHSFAPYKLDRATHRYLENLDQPSFTQRLLDHHREYLGLYWSTLLRSGVAGFRKPSEMRWGWLHAQGEPWSALDSAQRVGTANARMGRVTPVADIRTSPFAASFARTLDFLRSRGADVCVVTMPISSELYAIASQDTNTIAALRFIRETAITRHAQYENFYGLYAQFENDDYFIDADHLNHIGAPVFTEKAMAACFGDTRALQTASER
jgi:hypothetical protein